MAVNDDPLGLTTEPVRRAQHVAFSLEMLSKIAAGYDERVESGDEIAYLSMIDSFFVHLRLLGDFLIKPTSRKDFGPDSFGVTWQDPGTDAATRLGEHWDAASRYIVHFSNHRVPASPDDLLVVDVNSEKLTKMAQDAVLVMDSFVHSLVEATQSAKLLADRMPGQMLKYEIAAARERVGLDRIALPGP